MFRKVIVLLLLITLTSAWWLQKPPRATKETLSQLDGEIRKLLKEDPERIGGFVRLAFHDCVGRGRCDGCIDHHNHDNKGLAVYTKVLNNLFTKFSNRITRADLYAFAAIVAANYASTSGPDAVFKMNRFKVGRRDCSRSGQEDDNAETFPGPNMQNVHELVNFFNKTFGLNLRETVALMGAHSLGRLRTKNSGFEGPWIAEVVQKNGANILDSRYYLEIVAVHWFLKVMPTNNKRHQWQREGPSMGVGNSVNASLNAQPDNILIHSDAALAFNFHLDENGAFKPGKECIMCSIVDPPPAGDLPCCDIKSAGRQLCIDYALNNTIWMHDFTDVFYKMIDNPDGKLTLPISVPVRPRPPPHRRLKHDSKNQDEKEAQDDVAFEKIKQKPV
ncbi:putative ascorbate peroxidase [Clytia hemisphaerica]|uniref:Plant heme peroxidase family profile domain-containing protein n=1 Tax=Clytia hemisphaerica TaxID=252671 RepID=A0A7M5UIZ1_9CNID